MSTSTITSLIAVGALMALVLLFAILILVKRQTTYVLVSLSYIKFLYVGNFKMYFSRKVTFV